MFTAYGNICKNNVCKKTGLDNSSITPATSYPVEVSSARYATYRTSEKLDFTSTGLQPYTVDAGAASIVLQPIEDGVVPAGKAVVVYGEAGTYDVPVTAVDATVSETGLLISDGTSAVGSNVYVLTKKDGEVGFGHWTGATSLSKGKVYITRPASAPEFLSLVIGEPTTVEAVPTTAGSPSADADCYNLQGQRVARPGRGLYIVNGKKMIKR
ncbi:MAG: hypothetical protein IJ637_06920 [Prevotella sp.]|nr:hypothetical protein [Prevotella sp.]